jgi:membrane fusion protein, copper/silver efflux system
MKIINKAGVIVVLASLAACGAENNSQSDPKGGTTSSVAAAGTAATHSGTGKIESVSGSIVTIAHEEIKSIGWPAMQMGFAAANPALLNGIQPGDRVTFAFTANGSTMTLTKISKQ